MYNLLDGPRSPTTIDPTTKVNIVQGTYRGFKVKFIDTPGLHMASSQLARNMDVLNAAKKAFNKHKPDLVLYVDRMDELRGRFGDLPLLRSISDKFGASIWFNTILLLTHGGAPPLESTNGPMMFEVYMQTRTQYLQTVVRRAAGDQRYGGEECAEQWVYIQFSLCFSLCTFSLCIHTPSFSLSLSLSIYIYIYIHTVYTHTVYTTCAYPPSVYMHTICMHTHHLYTPHHLYTHPPPPTHPHIPQVAQPSGCC